MPRKLLDNRFPDYLVQRKRGNCALFLPSGEGGVGQSPKMGQLIVGNNGKEPDTRFFPIARN